MFNEEQLSDLSELTQKIDAIYNRIVLNSGILYENTKNIADQEERIKLSKQEISNLNFLENNQIEYLKNKMGDLRSQIELAGARYAEYPGFIEKLNKELETTEKKLRDLRHESATTFREMLQMMDQGSRQFDSIRGLFVSFVEFNKTMQNINLQMFQGGFQNLSSGYTPTMSQGFDIVSSNRQLVNDITARQTTAIVTGITTAVGALIGMIGGPTGSLVGMGAASTLTTSLLSIFSTEAEKMKAKFGQMTSIMGLYTKIGEDNKQLVDRTATFFTSQGLNFGGELPDTKSDVFKNYSELNQALIGNQAYFAGKQGFERENIGNLMTKFGTSQQFQNLGAWETMQMANNTQGLSSITGMSTDAIMSIFVDLKMKLDTPTDQLVGRFMQLNRVAQEFQIPLSQVVQDLGMMRAQNMRYGFTQEQLIGLYTSFNKEIKEGTVNAAKLSEYMKGIADLGTEKSIGAMALLTSIPQDKLLESFTGNRGAATQFLGALNQMSTGEKGLFNQLVNNPEADFTKISGATNLMQKYGLSQADLRRMNPVPEQLAYAVGDYYANQSGDSGIGNVIQQKITSLLGINIPNNLMEAGFQRRGMETVGTRSGIGLGGASVDGDIQLYNRLNMLHQDRNTQLEADLKWTGEQIKLYNKYTEARLNLEKTSETILTPLELHYKALKDIYPEMEKGINSLFNTLKKRLNELSGEDLMQKAETESHRNQAFIEGGATILTGWGYGQFGQHFARFAAELGAWLKGYK